MGRLCQVLLARLAFVVPGGGTLRPHLHRLRGAHIGDHVWISQHVYIDELYPAAIHLGNHVTIGLRTSIFAHFHWGGQRAEGGFKEVHIEDDAFIGPHCVILPGVRIGKGAVVKAGSVVTRSIPPGVFWGDPGGQPLAKATVPLTSAHSYDDFVQGLRSLPRRRSGRKDDNSVT